MEVVEGSQLGSSQFEKDASTEEADEGCEGEGQSDSEEAVERWIDVKDLKNMSLDELKTLSTDNSKSDADRRLDLPITKVVVRRLPPQITVQDYLQELSEVPSYNYIRLVPPNEDLPSRIGKRSSIYINFDTEQEAFWFKEKYNNMKFFDDRGNSYIACVDFSFIQDISQDPPDEAQVGSLEESDMYQAFLKAYEEEPWSFTMNRPENIPTPEVMLDEILNKKVTEPESTPLLQFLRERSLKKETARKEREQRRKDRDIARRKAKEEMLKRRQKEKEEAAKRKQKEKEETLKRKPLEEGKDREKDSQRDRRKERDRERQRERDRERRLRREREKLEGKQSTKSTEDPHSSAEKSSHTGKESAKSRSEKEGKQKTSAGTVTYSRSGNPTRWSENSGPRKGEKSSRDDHKRSQEQLNTTKDSSSSDKLPVEKSTLDNQSSNSKTKDKDVSKSAFGKPFPTMTETSTKKDTENENKDKVELGSGDSCNKTNTNTNDGNPGNRKETNPDGRGGITKKRVVKRVIKVKKLKDNGGTENFDDVVANDQQSGSADTKPKKIIRVVKKSSKSDDGSSSKAVGEAAVKKSDSENKIEVKASATDHTKDDSEKDRKHKKGRPEIQIYRPGSLRGGASKSATSAASSDKERKGDNNS